MRKGARSQHHHRDSATPRGQGPPRSAAGSGGQPPGAIAAQVSRASVHANLPRDGGEGRGAGFEADGRFGCSCGEKGAHRGGPDTQRRVKDDGTTAQASPPREPFTGASTIATLIERRGMRRADGDAPIIRNPCRRFRSAAGRGRADLRPSGLRWPRTPDRATLRTGPARRRRRSVRRRTPCPGAA